ncbi:MAG: cation-transporting P-type ATPase [Anaerolineales bacterium]
MSATPVYSLNTSDVFTSLETSLFGLSSEEARSRLSLYGPNLLSEQNTTPLWFTVASQVLQPLTYILWGASLLALFFDPVLSGVILLITFANAGFSFWREYRVERATRKLQEILPVYAHVRRDGQERQIPAREVVPGDILILAEGDNIPADARVVEEYGLRANNATLTGESLPARKSADPSYQSGLSETEQPNLIFAGTSVAAGTGQAVVYATGMLTQFGRIAHLTQTVADEPSPFQRELARVVRVTSIAAIAIGGLILFVGLSTPGLNFSPRQVISFALGVIVAAIPEGLPATLTLSLASAVQRLAAKGVLVKKMTSVETLGNVSVICTDKSGTLTQNQMTAREIWVAGQRVRVRGVGYTPIGEFSPAPQGQPWDEDLLALLEAAACCNNARLIAPTDETPVWHSLGDQTEVALKVAALKAGLNESKLNQIYPRVHEIPFDARRKRMTTIHRRKTDEIAFVKGAPREVLQLCSHIQINNQVVALDEARRAEVLAANDAYARGALRVLAIARRELPPKDSAYRAEAVESELTLLGLVGMMDPPRPEVEQAIRVCRQASIRIVMITGDYGLTAESLARRVGMVSGPSPRIITGAELDELSESELHKALQQEVIFARMAPEHKMRLVAAFQAIGETVAVTGDGVNDAPALRKADVGIAMGIVGTDVAKEAADIILTNDNFGAIVSAIEEGRAVYDNVRKFVTYIFSSNVPELMPFLVAASFPGIPLALTVRQILAVDLGTDLLPALALGMETPAPGVMQKPPRGRGARLIDNALLTRAFLWLGMLEAAFCFVGFFSVYLFSGNATMLPLLPWLANLPFPDSMLFRLEPELVIIAATTLYHASVVMTQVGNALACRSESWSAPSLKFFANWRLWAALLAEILGIFILIYWQPLQIVFEHYPIPGQYWYGLFTFPLLFYAVEWARKGIFHLFRPHSTPSPEVTP